MKKIIAACLTVAAVGACATEGSDRILSYSEATQFETLQQCHVALGVQAPLITNTVRLNSGETSVFAVNGNGMSLEEARSINRCMQDSLLAYPPSEEVTYEVVPAASEPAPHPVAHQHHARKARQSVPGAYEVPGCPNSGTRLYRGTLYCVDGQVLQ